MLVVLQPCEHWSSDLEGSENMHNNLGQAAHKISEVAGFRISRVASFTKLCSFWRKFMMPCDGPWKPWQLLPQPFYSIAADGNLYTFQDFVAYYGIARAAKLNPNHPLTQTLPCLFPTCVKTFAKT